MRRMLLLCAVAMAALGVSQAMVYAAEGTQFVKTLDSNEWVTKTFVIQDKYERVLVVTTGEAPKTVSVLPLALNQLLFSTVLPVEYPVTSTYKTLQAAVDAAKGGDLIAVMPGTYAGCVVGDKDDCGDGKYIHLKAMGKPGEVTVNTTEPGKDRNWMIMLQTAHHVIVEGFNLAGTTGPGMEAVGPQAGIFIDGNFGYTGKMAHHIAIIGNFSHNHRSWGLHSTDSHTVLMQDNCFALSCREHSAYVSDGSDNYCIRRNIFFNSFSSGLQCNLDPDASLDELTKHSAFADYPPMEGTREWAQGLLKLATEKFGENNFPDGKGVNFIIEDNVVNGNGKNGGGSFNFAGLQDSLVQNNLVYENFTTGIAEWDNANSFDTAFADPGPQKAGDMKGPETVSYWGCQRNIIRNNTIVMNISGRNAMLLNNGSWGNVLRNNIFLNDLSFSIEVTNTSIYKLDAGYNVLNKITTNDMDKSLMTLAVALDEKNHSALGVTREKASGEFVKSSDAPWIIIEGNWWRLNPDRPDYRPKKGSALLAGKGDAAQMPLADITGVPRSGADIGAYAAAK